MSEIKFGFDEAAEIAHQSEKDYIFGASTPLGNVLMDDGDWRKIPIEFETQRKAYDGFICVSMANNNAEELMHKAQYLISKQVCLT